MFRLCAVMTLNNCRNFIGVLLLFAATFSFACSSTATQPGEVLKAEGQTETKQAEVNSNSSVEPITSIDAYKFSDSLEETWRRFTASGQYRLAQNSDMRFSDNAKENLSKNGTSEPFPLVYIWGDLNYNKRVEDDHLAAIVVDTTKTDNNRFSLVIFSPPKGKKDVYETHWFYRNRDLSKTTVNRASGSFFVTEYLDDGTQKSCSVVWNTKQKQFECEKLK